VEHQRITSLHSPHIERVKALLGPRGKKLRNEEHLFVADGIQSVREALHPKFEHAPLVEQLYLTEAGVAKLQGDQSEETFASLEYILVTEEVMKAMSETESPQGILALCRFSMNTLHRLAQSSLFKIAYFWEIQDPGNAGTVIRTADACGYQAVVFSPRSVDIYSPKTVRATVGSLWHLPVVPEVSLEEMISFAKESGMAVRALGGDGSESLLDLQSAERELLIFGNEARGLPELESGHTRVRIPMVGSAESLNVASAAAIAMFHLGTASTRPA
jgi:TrmH family RNA methyltransferase